MYKIFLLWMYIYKEIEIMWKKVFCNCFKRCFRNEIFFLNLMLLWLNLELDFLGICCIFGVFKDYKCLY